MATQAPDNDIAGTQAANQAALDSGQVKLGVAQGQQGYQIPNAVVGQNVSGNPTAPTPPQTSPQTGSGETMVNGQLTYTGNVGGSGTTPTGIYGSNPDLLASGQASGYLDANGNILNAPTQSDIYSSTLKNFQPQIDALNIAKAQAEANVRSTYAPIEANRVGSNIAQQGRGGELGSNVGSAQTDTINTANANELTGALGASDAKYQDQINTILTGVNSDATTAYNAKLTAYTKSANDASNFKLTVAPGLANTAAQNAAQAAITSGIDLTDPAALTKWANSVAQTYTQGSGIPLDPNAVISAYKTVQATAQAATDAKNKAIADLANTYATIAKTQGETLTPEQAQAKATADLAATKANTAQSYASASASLAAAANSNASAAKTNAEAQQEQNNPPTKTVTPAAYSSMKTDLTSAPGQLLANGSKAISPNTWNTNLKQWTDAGYSQADFVSNFGYLAKDADQAYTDSKGSMGWQLHNYQGM